MQLSSLRKISEELADLFSLLHDGYIEEILIQDKTVRLKVSICYLAELFCHSCEFLHLNLYQVETFCFVPWGEEEGDKSGRVSQPPLYSGILNAKVIKHEGVSVVMECDGTAHEELVGGTLLISCAGYRVTSEQGVFLSLGEFKHNASYYWNEKFGS